MITISPAPLGNRQQIEDIRNQAIPQTEPTGPQEVDRHYVPSGATCILAWYSGDPVGYAIAQRFPASRRTKLLEIAVVPAFQRRRVGSRLLAYLDMEAAQADHPLYATVPEDNLPLQLLLRHCGWRALRIIPDSSRRNPCYQFAAPSFLSEVSPDVITK